MTHLDAELDCLEARIGSAAPGLRHHHEPQLRRVIAQMREEGHAVPERVRTLHAIILSEAIEAEFDNMPV